MMRAIPRLLLFFNSDGIKLTSFGDTYDTKSNILASFGKDGPDNLVRALRLDSKAAFHAVENYLWKNIAEAGFATWVANLQSLMIALQSREVVMEWKLGCFDVSCI